MDDGEQNAHQQGRNVRGDELGNGGDVEDARTLGLNSLVPEPLGQPLNKPLFLLSVSAGRDICRGGELFRFWQALPQKGTPWPPHVDHVCRDGI